MVALLAAVIAILLAAAVIVAVPIVVRHRRRLVPADARFARAVQAVADLAAAEHVPAPGVLVMPGIRGEPFCLGRPGQHHIALPRKLALLGNPGLFTALVRHELAHLAHRDVALSWLARSLSYVLGPLLAAPVIVALVQGSPGLALDILWRAGVLLGVVLLVVRGLLRAREYDADLRAARDPAVGHVLDVELSRRPAGPSGGRAVLAWHPGAAQRRAVLADPARATELTWLDGLILGFLIALARPLITGIASAGLLGINIAGLTDLIGALVLGPLFGATIGIGLWRHALAARGSGRPSGSPSVALGVLAGALLGQLASLAGVALGAPQVLVLVPVALAGATIVVGGLGELWVTGVGRARRPAAVWVPAALLGAATATSMLWAAPQAEAVLNTVGWPVVAAWLTAPAALVLPGFVAVLLAVAAGWAMRPRRDQTAPSWWGGRSLPVATADRGVLLVGLAAGVAGGIALAVHRAVAGPATSDVDILQRADAAVLGSGLVGVAVVVLLGLTRGPAGVGGGLLGGPLASLASGTSFLVVVAVVGGNPIPVAAHVLGGAVAAGFLLTVPAALLAALPVPALRIKLTTTMAVAVVLGGTIAATTMLARQVLVPGLSAALPGHSEIEGGPVPEQAIQLPVPRELYPALVARPILDGRVAEVKALNTLQAERPSDDLAATRIRTEIVPLLRQMLTTATDARIDDPSVAAVHQDAIAAINLHLEGFQLVADALDSNDPIQLRQGSALLADGNDRWERWAAGVAAL